MTLFIGKMAAALAAAVLVVGSPASAALQPSADLGPATEPALTPLPVGERLANLGGPAGPLIRHADALSLQDVAEAERRNRLIAPPVDERLHLYVAGAAGLAVMALLMAAMLRGKPERDSSADA